MSYSKKNEQKKRNGTHSKPNNTRGSWNLTIQNGIPDYDDDGQFENFITIVVSKQQKHENVIFEASLRHLDAKVSHIAETLAATRTKQMEKT